MIHGVRVKMLKAIPDERGRLMEILRCDDEIFERFGQVYFTTAYPGVVKAWHYHRLQTDHFTCVRGKILLGLYDSRPESPTFREVNEFILGPEEPRLVKIPALVYHGFKGLAAEESMVINIPTLPYNREKPDEYRLDPFTKEIPFDWRREK